MVDVLYLYTSKSGFEKIIKNPEKFVIDAQKFSRNRSIKEDPDYKVGYYFTDITPQNNTWSQISQALFDDDSKSSMKKCEYFVVIQHRGNVKQFEKNTRFYMLPESTTTKQKFVMGGRTDTYSIPEDEGERVKIGKPYITVYEKARIIGSRALQLSHGAPPLIEMQENKDLIELAQLELKTRVLPIGIERKLPNGKVQTIPIQWLSDKDFIQQINVSSEIKAFRDAIHNKDLDKTEERKSKEPKVKEKMPEDESKNRKEAKPTKKTSGTEVLVLSPDADHLTKLPEVKDWKGAITLDPKSVKNTGLRTLGRKKVNLTDDLLATQRFCETKVDLDFKANAEPPSSLFPSKEVGLDEIEKLVKNSSPDKVIKFNTYLTVDGITILGSNSGCIFEKKQPKYVLIEEVTPDLRASPSVDTEFKGHFNYFALKEMGFNTKDLKIAFINTTPESSITLDNVVAYLNGDKSALGDSVRITQQSMTKKREDEFNKTVKDLIGYWKKERDLKPQKSKNRCEICPHNSSCKVSLLK